MNKHITDYTIVGGFTSDDLVKHVQEKMKEGYEPYGSPFVILEEMVQPMIKWSKTDNYHSQDRYAAGSQNS